MTSIGSAVVNDVADLIGMIGVGLIWVVCTISVTWNCGVHGAPAEFVAELTGAPCVVRKAH